MPFKNREQQKACYAKDDPNWDCDKWSAETKKSLRGKKKMATGGLYDYMQSKGMDGSYENRKKMFNKLFNGQYEGTAEQNTKILQILQNQKSGPVASTKVPALLRPKDINTPSNGLTAYGAKATEQGLRAPDSGVVVDKRTGRAFVMQNGKPVKEFPVLTGKNVNGNIANATMEELRADESKKATPVGYYKMSKKGQGIAKSDMQTYDGNISEINPISAYGMPAPIAENLAFHQTAHPEQRNKYYNTATPWISSGCINGNCNDVKDVQNRFPQGDTLMVIDSRDPKFRNVLPRKQFGGPSNPMEVQETRLNYAWSNPAIPADPRILDAPAATDPNVPNPERPKIDPYFALRGITNGLSWLSGKVARNRQNQYMMDQYNQLGQLDPMQASDYQPTNNNMYFQMGGRRVDAVPEGYNFLKEEGGKKYYNKIDTIETQRSNVNTSPARSNIRRPHTGNTTFKRALRPAAVPQNLTQEDLVYLEGQQQPVIDTPAWAGRGEYIQKGKHMAGEIMYPSRNSKDVTDGGGLDTSAEDLMFQFRDDFGKGEMVPIKKQEIQKFFGTSNAFQETDPTYSYDALKARSSQVKKLKKGGKLKFRGWQ